jgi:hypothetical protein
MRGSKYDDPRNDYSIATTMVNLEMTESQNHTVKTEIEFEKSSLE